MLELSDLKRIKDNDVRAMYYRYVALTFLDKELSYAQLKCLALLMSSANSRGMLMLDQPLKETIAKSLKITSGVLNNRITELVKKGVIVKEKRGYYKMCRFYKIDSDTVIEIKNSIL